MEPFKVTKVKGGLLSHMKRMDKNNSSKIEEYNDKTFRCDYCKTKRNLLYSILQNRNNSCWWVCNNRCATAFIFSKI